VSSVAGIRWLPHSLLLATGFFAACSSTAVLAQPSGRGQTASAERRALYQRQYAELHATFRSELEKLAAACLERNLAAEAASIRKLGEPVDPGALVFESLPEHVQPELRADLPPDERFWRARLAAVRKTYAHDLYLLARRVLNAGFPSQAFRLVHEVAQHDPDHKSARALLGEVQHGDRWITPYARSMLARNYEWHDRFGWLLKGYAPRYEKGERFFKGRWIPAAQEDEIRRDFKLAWEVRTDHYLVRTNHSLERGVEVARRLERFHDFFFQVFAGFFDTPEQMQKLFDGGTGTSGRPPVVKPYVVHYYRTREDYQRELIRKIPQIAITNGLYYTTDRTAYFFHDEKVDVLPTLYHEASHQILYESQSRERSIAEQAHFWIVEGIACYMESFRDEGSRVRVGDPEAVRFDAARYRYLVDKYHVPLGRLAAMSMREFQSDPQIARNYSEASGLAHFLMHYDGGRYREALVQHLAQLYSGDPRRVQGLDDLTGVPLAELDRQYGEHLREQQREVDAAAARP
jgi:hypothetical protein